MVAFFYKETVVELLELYKMIVLLKGGFAREIAVEGRDLLMTSFTTTWESLFELGAAFV